MPNKVRIHEKRANPGRHLPNFPGFTKVEVKLLISAHFPAVKRQVAVINLQV